MKWLIFASQIKHKQIAEVTGLSRATISRINTGKQRVEDLTMENLIRIYDYAVSQHTK